MPTHGQPTHLKLKATLWLLLLGGLISAVLGQRAGAHWGVPDLGTRIIFTAVPYVLLAIALFVLPRSRADLIVLLVCAVVAGITNMELFGRPDELGLIYMVVPIESAILVLVASVAIVIRRLVARWLKRRKGAAAATAQNF